MTEESKVSLYGGPEKQNSSKLFPLLFSCDGDKKQVIYFLFVKQAGKTFGQIFYFLFFCVVRTKI